MSLEWIFHFYCQDAFISITITHTIKTNYKTHPVSPKPTLLETLLITNNVPEY